MDLIICKKSKKKKFDNFLGKFMLVHYVVLWASTDVNYLVIGVINYTHLYLFTH